ncbi:MAG TPA: sulfatase-like hydrolase/transferase [Terriglobia bacterium]|nr:sulfatase-like hydrolase/transferase [Terriglobia bacterium]
MAGEPIDRRTIIVRVGLLGATAGIVVGLFEAGFMRFSVFPVIMPHVPFSFWFFAPLLASMVFGSLGLLAGVLVTLTRARFLGMVIIAAFAGLAGCYLARVLQFSQSGSPWYPALQPFITPLVFFTVVSVWMWGALWATRKPNSPLGFLADVPQRLWSGIIYAAVAILAAYVGISHLPGQLTDSTAHAMGKGRSPNIVLIVMDTTRADHLSSYGYFRNTTPNIDQLARRGVLFEHAVSASSWTLPSTFSMFTCLLPHQHGSGTDRSVEARTLAEILRARGYETAGFNSNPYCGTIPSGVGRGFEKYLDSTTSIGYSLAATRIGNEFIEPFSERWFQHSRFNQLSARQLNEEIYYWYSHRSGHPYFLYLNYNDAHDPYDIPSPYDHRFGSISPHAKQLLLTAKLNHVAFSPSEREGLIASYDNCLSYIDNQVGELLRLLERSPEWSNTYIIVTSDHGEGFGEHHSYSHGWNLYRELLHVPLIIAGPGVPSGLRVPDIAGTRRIFSTALEFAGAKSQVLSKSSLTRLWAPDNVSNKLKEHVISELVITQIEPWGMGRAGSRPLLPIPHGVIAITTPEWHLIYGPGAGHSELYHWPTDPLEQHDVSDLPENQAAKDYLSESVLAIIRRSYRPWRDTDYLLALSSPNFSPDLEASKPVVVFPDVRLLPQGIGAAQAIFPPNQTAPHPTDPEQDLLESLPYTAR